MSILHLALRADWAAARSAGDYRVSTLGRTLEQEGFIHCSRDLEQLRGVHAAFYGHVSDPLVVLEIDPTGLDVRFEGGFPHVYGPIPLESVTAVRPYEPTTA
ncbi:DUF952 domain-containing protein [Nonomuraea lactucae]|uniref:DUF952 domain-containing protein n=1 Tax=Nonomuraea lactucae TaxID=2249762 RepID=UPI000DE3E242|nr:DUF952 domain-containing protein [Nonomuraea lactucae]